MKEQRYNLGLELLRALMCYGVVATHFWNPWKFYLNPAIPPCERFLLNFRNYAVPVFMLMAFYFAAQHVFKNEHDWQLRRLKRLFVPYWGWALISFGVFSALTSFSPAFACTVKDLGWQLLLGTDKAIGSHMWFQSVLIILSAIFAGVFAIPALRQRPVPTLAVLFLAAVAVEYSGLNYALCKDLPFEVKIPFGRVFPMMSSAVLGLLFGLYKTETCPPERGRRAFLIVLGALGALFVANFPLFVRPEGFHYVGLNLPLVAAALFIAFANLPFERLPDAVDKCILFVSRRSMGIYFIHIVVGRVMTELLFPHLGFKPDCLRGTLPIFIVCLALCVLLERILPKPLKGLVA